MTASRQATDESALLKAILRESATEVLLFDADTLRITQASPAATRNLQYPLDALQQLTLLDCLSAEDAATLPPLLATLQSGKKRRAPLQAHCCRRDGSLYPVEARVFRSAGHGKPLFVWSASDVSQREATRQALESTASDLRAIVAHIPGMAYQVLRKPDGSTSMCYVSEQSAQLLGIKAATLQAHPERFYDMILQDDRADYQARLAQAGGSHLTFNWEGRIWMEEWKDVKWVNIRVSQRKAPRGHLWSGIMLNVTRSKLAEAEIRRSREQLSALAAHVESVKETERLHLAREVHDDLGGNLTAIKIGLSWLKRHLPSGESGLIKRTAYLDDIVDQTMEATHRIASSLRPPVLDFGIVSAIEWQLQHFGRNTGLAYTFNAPDEAVPLSADASITVFRIVQEALTNVAKHAHATRVRVTLALPQGELLLTVTDNGQGLTPVRSDNGKHGFGVLGMAERAAALGGELSVLPARRRGTEVRLRIPLPDSLE